LSYIVCAKSWLRCAVKAVVDFVQSGYRSFTYRQECDIKRYMNSQPDKEKAAGTVLKASLPFLKSDKCERVKGQLSYIVQNMKEEHQKSQNRNHGDRLFEMNSLNSFKNVCPRPAIATRTSSAVRMVYAVHAEIWLDQP
jgi:hypothetical protein